MSALSKPKILITGQPGCGKTTLIKKVIKTVSRPSHGFLTEEILQSGRRVGFAIKTLSQPSREGVLSHVGFKSDYRVGKYGVDIESFENIVLPELNLGIQQKSLIIIDEIGKMELFSTRFKEILTKIFESDLQILASIMLKPQPFCDKLTLMPDIKLLEINRGNRNRMAETAVATFTSRSS